MICVTVGTHDQPFTRLIGALALLGPEELVVQHGPAPPPAGMARAVRFMPFDELQLQIAAARVVITHAGVGSILAAVAAGHTPIVVPRLRRYGEHVDDHQLEFALALGRRGDVIPLLDVERLPDAVASVPTRRPSDLAGEGPLHIAVREALLPRNGAVVRRLRGGRLRRTGHVPGASARPGSTI
jgi:UDP-N-acetylglucosamine transferase subunit ALG13